MRATNVSSSSMPASNVNFSSIFYPFVNPVCSVRQYVSISNAVSPFPCPTSPSATPPDKFHSPYFTQRKAPAVTSSRQRHSLSHERTLRTCPRPARWHIRHPHPVHATPANSRSHSFTRREAPAVTSSRQRPPPSRERTPCVYPRRSTAPRTVPPWHSLEGVRAHACVAARKHVGSFDVRALFMPLRQTPAAALPHSAKRQPLLPFVTPSTVARTHAAYMLPHQHVGISDTRALFMPLR